MERLTKTDENGVWNVEGVDWRDVEQGLYGALCKLKEYEDTGLSPSEIMDGKMLTGWIPVDERLPEDRSKVLVYKKHFWKDGWRGYDICAYEKEWQNSGNLCEVIAWMPLPEPYTP